jgi:hypothetical protein
MPGVKLNLTGWEDGEQVEKDVEVGYWMCSAMSEACH